MIKKDPILCVPSTYLINNDGIPSDIIPSMVNDDELKDRLEDGLKVKKNIEFFFEKSVLIVTFFFCHLPSPILCNILTCFNH